MPNSLSHNLIAWSSNMLGGKPTLFRALFNLFSLQINQKYFWTIDLWFILHKLKEILSWCRKSHISSFFSCSDFFFLLLLFLLIHWFFWLHFPQRVQWAILSLQRQQKLCSHSTSYWIFNDYWPKHSVITFFTFLLPVSFIVIDLPAPPFFFFLCTCVTAPWIITILWGHFWVKFLSVIQQVR